MTIETITKKMTQMMLQLLAPDSSEDISTVSTVSTVVHSKGPYVMGLRHQQSVLQGWELLFPQQQGSAHSGDQGQEDGVSQFPSCSEIPPI